ncbi:6091_t:CDS:2 [Paraglomus occultum]|uniref:6091_t:CDS:1 n=1 Tax=Paraglomus occultum TaxID=144539 RepID=A0A9N8Z8N7_9GLOM|nr:6091_t:CDS:2 [Paraglomus occultum]
MAGPNLEIFKFSVYIFFPIAMMYYFGDPKFYEKHIRGTQFWPELETTNKPPTTKEDARIEFEKMKAKIQESSNNSTST